MWFRKKKQTETKIVTVDPPVMNLMRELINIATPRVASIMPESLFGDSSSLFGDSSLAVPETPEQIEKRKKEMTEVDAFITTMEPEIKIQTEALIKEEIREMLLMGGNRPRILELLRAGKTPRIIRKKEGRRDPLFLQFGDGLTDPIEEMRILG